MSDDPLSFFRGLFHALWITLALILFGCVLAKSVWPDDINVRKEYRSYQCEQFLGGTE